MTIHADNRSAARDKTTFFETSPVATQVFIEKKMPRMTFNTNAISHIQNGIDEVVAKHFLFCQNTSLNIIMNTKKAS